MLQPVIRKYPGDKHLNPYKCINFAFGKLNTTMVFNKKKRWHCLPGGPVTELDKKIMFWENKGKLVPTRDMIRTPEQIEGIRMAGKLTTGCLDAVAAKINECKNTQDIDDFVMDF